MQQLPARVGGDSVLAERNRSALRVLAAILPLVLLVGACAHTPRQPNADFLSPLALPTAQGDRRLSAAELRGQVVLVSFFATWCAPCLVQLPDLRALHEEHSDEGFTVIGVGMDLEGALVLEPFARSYELPFPVVVPDERLREGRTAYGRIAALPITVILRRDGTVARSFAGTANREQLERWVRAEISR